MVTSLRRRRMWWARKASARGMHVWKGRAACARGRYTWQVAEINKKWGLAKEWIERCLMQEAWKNKQTNKQSHFCIRHFLKDNNKRDSYNKLNSLSFCFRSEVSGQRNYFSLMSYDCPTREKSKNWKHNQCSTLMFLDTRHKLLAHKNKLAPLVQEIWRLFKT